MSGEAAPATRHDDAARDTQPVQPLPPQEKKHDVGSSETLAGPARAPGQQSQPQTQTKQQQTTQQQQQQEEEEDKDKSKAEKKKATLPAWLDHFNGHDLKILVRCWAACWVALLLVFIQPSLSNVGQATFFGALVLFIVPPASVVFVYLLASLSLLLGMCLAWVWGLATMKAALAARPQAETDARLQALQQQAAVNANHTGQTVAWEAQILVHEGFMLDARVTAVYYVMGCVFIYALARLRCSNPKFTLTQLFGTIAFNIFLLIGPTLPTFTGDVGEVLVKPGAIGIGLGLACCLLFFPMSTSYVVLDAMGKLVTSMDLPLDLLRRKLACETVTMEELQGARAKLIGIYKGMQPAMVFLPLDFSRGRWNAGDIKSLQEPVREALTSVLSLIDVHLSWVKAIQREALLKGSSEDEASSDDDKSNKEDKGSSSVQSNIGLREARASAQLIEALRTPEQGDMDNDALRALHRTTGGIIGVCSDSLELANRCIHTVNSCRWIGKPSQQQFDELVAELQAKLATLSEARTRCVVDTTEGVLEAYADIFDEKGELKPNLDPGPPALRGIVIAMVIEERILLTAAAVGKMLEQILELMRRRTTHRVWFPSSLAHGLRWVVSSKTAAPVGGGGGGGGGAEADPAADPDRPQDDGPDPLEDDAKEAYRRLKLSRGYGAARFRARNALASRLVAAHRWLFNPAGGYALRMVVVTVALAIPSAIPHTAGFFYREKGIWAVITAQTGMLVYMADFTFSLATRLVGTIVGGVLGMLAWYVGSGGGNGNPYGLGASSAVVLAGLVWLRIWLPPAYTKAAILGGATFCLVVGFSYDQHHLVLYGLPGVGYVAFWKRCVVVLVGFAAASLVQIFPRPPSAHKHVCKSLSASVRTLSDHYALLLSHWSRGDGARRSPLAAVSEHISLEVGESLFGLNEMIALLRFEMTTGPFNQQLLRDAQTHLESMNQSLRRLLTLSTIVPKPFQDRLAQSFGLLDDRVIGDIMAVLSIIEQSLITGAPLPERLPTPLVGQFYECWKTQHGNLLLSTSLVRDEDYRRYCVALSSYLRFLSTIDDMVMLLKRGLGECHCIHPWEDEV